MIGRLEIFALKVLEFFLVYVKKIPAKSEFRTGEFQNHGDQKNFKNFKK